MQFSAQVHKEKLICTAVPAKLTSRLFSPELDQSVLCGKLFARACFLADDINSCSGRASESLKLPFGSSSSALRSAFDKSGFPRQPAEFSRGILARKDAGILLSGVEHPWPGGWENSRGIPWWTSYPGGSGFPFRGQDRVNWLGGRRVSRSICRGGSIHANLWTQPDSRTSGTKRPSSCLGVSSRAGRPIRRPFRMNFRFPRQRGDLPTLRKSGKSAGTRFARSANRLLPEHTRHRRSWRSPCGDCCNGLGRFRASRPR